MSESRSRPHPEVPACRLVAECPEADHDSAAFEKIELSMQEPRTVVTLVRRRLVRRRRTSHRSRHPCVGQRQTVVRRDRFGLIRESDSVHRSEQPVTASIAGEHPAGAVRTVGRWRKPQHDHSGIRIAKAGNGPPPVLVITVGRPTFSGDFLAPLHESPARTAVHDFGAELLKRRAPDGVLADACHGAGQ